MKRILNTTEFMRTILMSGLLVLLIQAAYSQSFENGYYRLTTKWLGDDKSLDVVNDGANNQLQMAHTANQSGQFWKITPLGNGYFRLTTSWQGDGRSLDVVNDGNNNKLQLARTENVTGQYWKIASVGDGYYRLTTKWLGDGKSLDIVNDASKSKVRLAESGNYSGQLWKITKVSADQVLPVKRQFTERSFSGFKVLFDSARSEDADMKTALGILSASFAEMERVIKPKHLERLRTIPLWIEYLKKDDGAMWYHSSKDWLLSNGYPAEMEKSVEVKNLRNFIDWQGDQPFMVLHEFAHAHQDQFIPALQEKIDLAFKKAQSSGKYNSVRYIRGGSQKAYAMSNKVEYFAELSEAYFGKNDYYPFSKEDLRDFDPAGFELMEEAWN